MTYIKVNVSKPDKTSPGRGEAKTEKITIVDLDDLLTEAKRDSKGVVITDKHIFKTNAYAVTLYMTPNSFDGKITSDGDPDKEGVTQEVVLEHPGTEKEIREFRVNFLGKNVMIFSQNATDGQINQYGYVANPLRMKVVGEDNKDVKTSTFTFTSITKGDDIAIYENTLTLSEPVAVVAADATSIDLSSGEGEYQLTDNTAATAIDSTTNAVDGMLFTLLGSGGSNPASIASGGDFLLKSGTSWSGIANATITFKVFKDGAATFKYIEVSRS